MPTSDEASLVDPTDHAPPQGAEANQADAPATRPIVKKKQSPMKLALFVLGGALAGYLYYRLVGCRSGACPITSSPIISSLYGAMLGFLMSRG